MKEYIKPRNGPNPGTKSINRRKVLQRIAAGTSGLAGLSGIGSAHGPPGGQIGCFKYRFFGCRAVYINRTRYASIRVKDGEDCIWREDWQRINRKDIDWDRIYAIKVDKDQAISHLCTDVGEYNYFINNPNGCAKDLCEPGCR